MHGIIAVAESDDDMNVLRAWSIRLILGHRVMAPSKLGTYLRTNTFEHVRQHDRVPDHARSRSWESAAAPNEWTLVINIYSFVG